MSSKPEGTGTRPCWFVGAAFGGIDDQSSRFIQEGTWEISNPSEKETALVKSIQPGDLIAIKSAYVRKHGLPFDNRGNTVSVMAIKAIGKVKSNPKNGYSISVDWTALDPPREWYFYTYRATIWRVLPGNWEADALISFAFEGENQDIDRFRNAPYWHERFGDVAAEQRRFNWTRFYESLADKLLEFKDKRDKLIEGIHRIAKKVDCMSILQDQYEKGSPGGPLKDICPFTVMGIFNRGIKDDNRKIIAAELAALLGVSEPIPESFEGIPVVNNQRSWFFGYHYKRQPDDIDALWEIFSQGIAFSEADNAEVRSAFIAAFDNATQRWGVGWNLTIGLYWIRPWNFPTLDNQSRSYITKKLNIQIGLNGPKGRCSADDYLTLMDSLETRFKEEAYPVHSFPELSLAAWNFKDTQTLGPDTEDENDDEPLSKIGPVPPIEPYSVDNILADGCFFPQEKIEIILERLRTKKNIILQGPPGTGKTWIAKRLALALIGQLDDTRVRAVQFHPNLSYEDFIRGWRPAGDGRLTLVDGPFLEMINAAEQEPKEKHVIVIDEINRGNPAQIFGEMLTLLEADKRTPSEALELCYTRSDNKRVFIPDNLYVIGTMNIADRSLALVDFALRRRFAFIDLEPALNKAWHNWVHSRCGIDSEILTEIEKRLNQLNSEISADVNLGPQFRVGHSYVTPPFRTKINDGREWFRQVVETEIGPLLDEYWFDDFEKAQKARERLLEGF